MKIRSIWQKTTATVLLAVGATVTLGQISLGQSNPTEFYCGVSDGVPTTMVKSRSLGEAPLIRWTEEGFNLSAQQRCNVVSDKFQTFYEEGTLDYVTSGQENGYPVVCVTRTLGGSCEGRVLFTLPKGTDPDRAIAQIFRLAGPYQKSDSSDARTRSSSSGRGDIKMDRLISEQENRQ